jgi:hypothetical protein
MEALPIGKIDLPVIFGDMRNFRTETLTFEMVGFSGTYHTILGRPAYVKFMVAPNYTYLKLKIPGPKGIITVGLTYQRAYKCDAECFQFAEAIIWSERLRAEPRSKDQDVPSRPSEWHALSSLPRTSRMRSSPMTVVRSLSGRRLILNRKARPSTSSKRTSTCSRGNPLT